METKNFVKGLENKKIFKWKNLNIFFVVFVLGIFLLNNVSAEDKIYNRTISFSPSITEIIYDLHAEDQLIGVTAFCNHPPEAKNKTNIGYPARLDIEKTISLNPDLVFIQNVSSSLFSVEPKYIEILQDLNITVVFVNYPKNIEEIYDNIRTIAKYLGKEKEAENLIKNMKERLENAKKIKNKFVSSTPKIALINYVSVGGPLSIVGRDVLPNNVIEIAGGVNVYSDIYMWETVDPETLYAKDPDIIITYYGNWTRLGGSYSNFMNDSRFKNLRAVKNNDVYKIDEDIRLRHSLRIIDAVESVIGMMISWQYNHTPKYCMNDNDCDSKQCNLSIHICMKSNGEKCVLNEECLSGNCENGVCKVKKVKEEIKKAGDKIYNRTISTFDLITAIIYGLHAEDQLIGVSTDSDYPPEAKNKTDIGFRETINIEKIISLNPDLVFVMNMTKGPILKPDHIKILQDANITVAMINLPYSVEDVYYNIRTIAKYLGKEKEAENLIKDMEKRIENAKKVKNKYVFSTPKIAQIYYGPELWATGRNTLPSDLMEIAGGVNVFSDVHGWKTIDPESLIAKDPDIILLRYHFGIDVGWMNDPSAFMNDSRFKNLKAVKNKDVYKIDARIFRGDQRIIDAIASVIGIIISWQYNHTPKYCIDDNDCDSKQCNMSIHICMKLDGEKCVLNEECLSGNCENGVCKVKGEAKKGDAEVEKPRGEVVQKEYCGDGKCTGNETYENCPQDCKKQEFEPLLIFVIVIIIIALIILIAWKKKKK